MAVFILALLLVWVSAPRVSVFGSPIPDPTILATAYIGSSGPPSSDQFVILPS